ncbi:MAG: GAF domain-containing protein [Chloroflexi bacterium]|nr:GAF domain-containing protein [Chloroflexota bacterium]
MTNQQPIDDNMKKRINRLFSDQELPSYASLSEVEAMKKRINSLETELAQQTKNVDEARGADSPTQPVLKPFLAERSKSFAQKVKISIQSKITLWAGLCLILVTVILVGYSVATFRAEEIKFAQSNAVVHAEEEAGRVRIQLEPALTVAINLAHSLGMGKDSNEPVALTREQANGILKKTLEENPEFLGTWTLWEPNAFDGLDAEFANMPTHDQSGRFIPYWVRTAPEIIEGVAIVDYETPGVGDFYLLPRQTKKNTVLPPYLYPVDNVDVLMTSMVIPIVENGRFYGVTGVDLQIDFVQNIVDEIDLYDGTASAVLFTDSGSLVAVRNQPELTLQPVTSVYEDFEQIKPNLGRAGTFISQSPDGKYLRVFSPIEFGESENYWYIGLSIPYEKITEGAAAAAVRQTSIGLGLLALALALLWVLTGQVVKPVRSLTKVAAEVAGGNLNVSANVRGNDEVGVLANVFNSMIVQLRDLFGTLEQRVADRTHDLELASEVGRTVATRVDNLNGLLNDAVELIHARFGLYYTQVYIADQSGRTITLRAGTGKVGRQLLQQGHKLLVGSGSLNGRAASEKHAIIVADTLNNEAFLPNPLLPDTRSEMSVPLLIGDRVVGVLDMQSEQTDALNENNLPAFEALAGQLAVAVQNATLFEEANQARKDVEQQAKRQSYADWADFLNAVERSEKLGYIFSQNEILPYINSADEPEELNSLHSPVHVAGIEIGKIHIMDGTERQWTTTEADIIHNTALQLSRHIENLRLLAQSEKYRLEAEQVSKRLTREGWEEYLNARTNIAEGYIYRENTVQPLINNDSNQGKPALSYPILVRGENIGELSVESLENMEGDASGIVSIITQQLSSHIENLRLLEETETSRAEVQKSQEQYKLAVTGSNDGLWDWDIANDQIYYSPRWKSMLGYEEHELTRGFQDWEDLIHPDDHDYATHSLDEYLEQQAQEYDVEVRLRHKDGSWRWIRDRGKALRRDDGTPYRMAGTHTDITQRKLDETIIAQRANQLETVAALSTTASTVLNPDELLQTVVDLTKERFGLYHAHVYLADESWKTLLLAAGAGDVGSQMVAAGHAISMDTERSLVARATRERNAIIVNDVRSEPDFLPNALLPETRAEMAVPMIVGDKILGVFDVQSEIEGRFTQEDASIFNTLAAQSAVALQNARLYQEQAATVTQLRELDRLKSSFLANMSHELRTPLNSILGFADVMLEELDGPLTPNMDNDLKLIQKNGQHLLHLINDVLDMAKIESGKLNLIIEKFNLHEIMEEVTSITSPLASEKNLALFMHPDSDHKLEISADRNRLRQVMINLLNNAMKFTGKGKISIRIAREGENALISVKDTGIGIHPSQLEAVFQEFTQIDSSTTRKAGGTGLGLPISRRLIELHGGSLWAESSGIEGQGATFHVSLPIESKVAASEPITRKL